MILNEVGKKRWLGKLVIGYLIYTMNKNILTANYANSPLANQFIEKSAVGRLLKLSEFIISGIRLIGVN